MKTILLLFVTMIASSSFADLSTPAEAQHREDRAAPKAPANIKFADVCSYDTWSSKLTCQDAGGNVLIDRQRMYKRMAILEHDKLPVFALMKRLGFDVKSTMQIGYTFEVIFYRRPSS